MSYSIIIPSYYSRKTISYFLETFDFDQPEVKEVIIVDSSETEEFKKLVNMGNNIKKIQFLHLSEKSPPAVARNEGARIANGDILVFIDSDAYPDDDWLNEIEKAINNNCQVGGGSICLPAFQKKSMIAIAQYFLQFNEFMPSVPSMRKSFVPSCNLFCKKALFDSVEGFPNIRASEDVLFGKKVNEKSSLLFVPKSKVYHVFNTKWSRLRRNQYLLGKYVSIYRRKHPMGLADIRIMQILLSPFLLLIKYGLLLPRIMKTSRENIILFIYSTPLIVLGLIYWSFGFFRGSISKTPLEI